MIKWAPLAETLNVLLSRLGDVTVKFKIYTEQLQSKEPFQLSSVYKLL